MAVKVSRIFAAEHGVVNRVAVRNETGCDGATHKERSSCSSGGLLDEQTCKRTDRNVCPPLKKRDCFAFAGAIAKQSA